MKSQLEREKLFSLSNEPSAWGAAQLRAAPCPVAKATKSDALAENETEWAFLVIYKQFDSGSGHRCSIPIWSALPVSSALFVCSFVTQSHPLADKDTECGFAPCPKAGTGTKEGHWWGRKLKQEGTVLAFRSSSWLCTNCIWLDISAVVHPETHSFDLMLCYESVFLCFPWGLLTPSS